MITANSANITAGGATGSGTYQTGQNCIIIAVSNKGFSFQNWTENGNIISTNPTFSFTVSANRTITANFIPTISVITGTSNSAHGNSHGGGDFKSGDTCHIFAIANNGFKFLHWLENGSIVSTNISYTFKVISARNLTAIFGVSAGISNNILNSVSIYPNPTNNILTIEVANNLKEITTTLYDIKGREVQKTKINGDKGTLDVSTLEKGIYFIKLSCHNKEEMYKIQKD